MKSYPPPTPGRTRTGSLDRKSTRLNSSHGYISYAVFCLKKKKNISHPKTVMTKIVCHFSSCRHKSLDIYEVSEINVHRSEISISTPYILIMRSVGLRAR